MGDVLIIIDGCINLWIEYDRCFDRFIDIIIYVLIDRWMSSLCIDICANICIDYVLIDWQCLDYAVIDSSVNICIDRCIDYWFCIGCGWCRSCSTRWAWATRLSAAATAPTGRWSPSAWTTESSSSSWSPHWASGARRETAAPASRTYGTNPTN